ncbi:MAG: hypothetical protein HF975_02160 [ANME-2 cluster archaeon]|nr:hypothetical protein [ANME-2 cluster archaeon]MBC2745806.1 hypothetical protein [ANME-2 cluster archaeon]
MLRHTSQTHPSQHPQSHGNSLEPRDDGRPYHRELRKIMESGWISDVKKARGLNGGIEKVFGERERLRG